MPSIDFAEPLLPHRMTELQLELECIAIEHGNLLVPVPCEHPDDIPRLLVVKHGDTYRSYVRHDLPQSVRHELERLSPPQAFNDPVSVCWILARDRPCDIHEVFQSYVFPTGLASVLYPDAAQLREPNRINTPVFGIIIDGHVVSACESVRENRLCAEAWVWTLPEFQRRGYARQVATAWAHHVQMQGKVPFYSHKVSNLASAAVARSLALVPFATASAYT